MTQMCEGLVMFSPHLTPPAPMRSELMAFRRSEGWWMFRLDMMEWGLRSETLKPQQTNPVLRAADKGIKVGLSTQWPYNT